MLIKDHSPGYAVFACDQLFTLRHIHDARISCTGRYVAYVVSLTTNARDEERFRIFVRDLLEATDVELEFSGDATCPRWSPDGTTIAFLGQSGISSRLYLSHPGIAPARPVSPEGENVSGAPSWSPDGSRLAYAITSRHVPQGVRRIKARIFRAEGIGFTDDIGYALRIVDLRTRMIRRLDLGLRVAIRPQYSPCGRRLLFLGADSAVAYVSFGGLRLLAVDLLSGAVATVLNGGWSIATAAWTPAGDRVVVAGSRNGPFTVPCQGLWVIGADGSDPESRASGLEGVVGLRMHHDMPTWNTSQEFAFVVPNSTQAFVTVTYHGRAEILRISLKGATNFETVISGDRSCLVMDACAETSQLLFCTSDMYRPWELRLADMTGRHEQQISDLNSSVLVNWPELTAKHLTATSPDGVAFEGWHVARTSCAGPQPTVMFIHGGPFLSVGHIFRFDFHLLALNGFAVLFANFRGSVGYGESFTRAIMGDWGARGYVDHMAAVDAAVSRGMADPEHLGVWGASHGGFAASWIVGHTSRFRAAVAESAITNFSTLYYLSDDPDVFARDLGGRPGEIPDVYRSRSPLTYAARCRTPTLLLHGQSDLRCPVAEAEQFYRALHDTGCTAELVIVPGMTHMGDSIGPLSARKGQNEALLDWFQRYL